MFGKKAVVSVIRPERTHQFFEVLFRLRAVARNLNATLDCLDRYRARSACCRKRLRQVSVAKRRRWIVGAESLQCKGSSERKRRDMDTCGRGGQRSVFRGENSRWLKRAERNDLIEPVSPPRCDHKLDIAQPKTGELDLVLAAARNIGQKDRPARS